MRAHGALRHGRAAAGDSPLPCLLPTRLLVLPPFPQHLTWKRSVLACGIESCAGALLARCAGVAAALSLLASLRSAMADARLAHSSCCCWPTSRSLASLLPPALLKAPTSVGHDVFHFIYFSTAMNQFVAPGLSPPYSHPKSQQRLLRQYQSLAVWLHKQQPRQGILCLASGTRPFLPTSLPFQRRPLKRSQAAGTPSP